MPNGALETGQGRVGCRERPVLARTTKYQYPIGEEFCPVGTNFNALQYTSTYNREIHLLP